MTRLEANLQILELLKEYFIKYPDQRFYQALHNLKFYDPDYAYNYESVETLKKLLDQLK